MKNKPLFRAVFAPVLFEMCGIIPLILVIFGVLNISAGVSLRNTLVYQYSTIFFIIAAGFFIYSVYLFLKQRDACSLSGLKKYNRPIIFSFIILSLLEALILLVLQLVEGYVYGKPATKLLDFITLGPFLLFALIAYIVFIKLHKD